MAEPHVTVLAFLIRLSLAALLGILIGFERQWRQRSAGLHTSSLVSIGAALFALLDAFLGSGDTTRIVGGIVTGVGFIAGGVILKSGANITGLNTAATMWATAAVGAFAGLGFWLESSAGAAMVIFLNLVLQPMAYAIDTRAKDLQDRETSYRLAVICSPETQAAVSDAILDAISKSLLSLQSLGREFVDENCIELQAQIHSARPDDARVERLAAALLSVAGVRRTDWQSASAS